MADHGKRSATIVHTEEPFNAERGGCGTTELELGEGEHQIVARAWDSAAATQPEDPGTVWNPKGYVNNSWSRVTVRATA